MKKRYAVVLIAILLAGCAGRTPAVPTADAEQVATDAVRTFQAQLTTDAGARPSQTPSPVRTTAPTETLGPVAPSPTLAPVMNVADKAELIAQRPVDGAEIQMGKPFDMVWSIRNDGPTTWTKNEYSIRYYAGLAMGERATFLMPRDVPSGEIIDLVVDMVAPNYTGEYDTIWVLTNDKGENFYQVYATLKVIVGPTSTFTITPGPSLTPSHTPTFLP